MRLDEIAPGSRVFVDSTIFIYHFGAASAECRAFFRRCAQTDVQGVTSVAVLAEVAHRLMTMEAVRKGLIPPKDPARRLRERPEIVRQLDGYQRDIERIPAMGVSVLPMDAGAVERAGEIRRLHGLLTNDSLVALAALESKADALASADDGFDRVPSLRRYEPGDLAGA